MMFHAAAHTGFAGIALKNLIAHLTVTLAKWNAKNLTQSEQWIMANSKPCPKCKRSIERNQGCMHMTCTPPCNFHFCWLCLNTWEKHGLHTGGFFACNTYTQADKEGEYDEIHQKVAMAKADLRKYEHYYERWATNKSSMKKAMLDFQQMQSVALMDKHYVQQSYLKIIREAWVQIIECRRVLMWTYAYGFYMPEQEHGKKQFFEYMQGEAECRLERLHQCAEELQGLDKSAERFITSVLGLRTFSRVTGRYFRKFVKALEGGLSDVKSWRQKNLKKRIGWRGGESEARPPIAPIARQRDWFCDFCTYENERNATTCRICGNPS